MFGTSMRFALVLALLAGDSPARAADPPLLIFAAASLTESMQELGLAFAEKTGTRVQFSFGASSDLARQIEAGAPADVFYSADTAKMDGLEKSGRVRKEDRREFLSNRLVVVVPAGSPLAITKPEDVTKLPRLALADPQAVPVGIYARKWLEGLGLWKPIETKIVPTLDVRAALAAVESEGVSAGIVYKTDAAISKKVRIAYEVVGGPEITYSLARIAAAKHNAADAFVAYVSGEAGRAVFARQGFVLKS